MIQDLETQIWDLTKKHTPSLQIVVLKNRRKIFESSLGTSYKYFDYASLTKTIFTLSALMWATDLGWCHPDDKVMRWVPWFANSQTKLRHLLSHRAGLVWWKPYYKLAQVKEGPESVWSYIASDLRVKSESTQPKTKCVYSDLDFFVLKFLVERIFERPLLEIWNLVHEQYFSKTDLHFNTFAPAAVIHGRRPDLHHPANAYAPTGACCFTKKIRRGLVHDDNTWSVGGVSTHAGLFGTLSDLACVGESLLSNLDKGALSIFRRREFPSKVGDWSLGFMMPSPARSSAGQFLSKESIGHLGFTGTSFWLDPKKRVFIGILSNRVLIDRENSFASLRGQVHDLIMSHFFKEDL